MWYIAGQNLKKEKNKSYSDDIEGTRDATDV